MEEIRQGKVTFEGLELGDGKEEGKKSKKKSE
jgi:hypothetical protein